MNRTRPHLHLAPPPPDATDAATQTIRVVLADDHTTFRRSMQRMLDAEPDVEVVADFADVARVHEHTEVHRPDVLVLDLHVANSSTVALVRQLRARFPDTALLILTMEDNAVFARQLLAAGAAGYVLKEHAASDLADAIRYVHAGETFVSAKVAAKLEQLDQLMGEDGLTARELEVLRLAALGYTSTEIAKQLHVSTRTVETHRARLHEKLQLRSRAELVQYALGRGLLNSEIGKSPLDLGRNPDS